MNIPRFLQLYKENRIEEAFESVIMDNPLPCFDRARLPASLRQALPPADARRAVNMREVHRLIADAILLVGAFERWCRCVCRRANWSLPDARLRWRAPARPV